MIRPSRASLETSLYDAGLLGIRPDLSISPLSRQWFTYAVPEEIRLASGIFNGPQAMIEEVEPSDRPGKIIEAKAKILYEPEWPWAEEGKQRLEYTGLPMDRAQMRISPSGGNCLMEFIDLAAEPPERMPQQILRFAKKWGVLGICRHGKPHFHRRVFDPPCGTTSHSNGWFSEPIEAWERYSRQLRAILLVSASLIENKPGNPQHWRQIEEGEPSGYQHSVREYWGIGDRVPNIRGERRISIERSILAFDLLKWCNYGKLKINPYWHGKSQKYLNFGLRYEGLTGRLAVELFATLSSATYPCKGCGGPIGLAPGERMRARGRDKWCSKKECQQTRANQASSRYYHKNDR